MPHETGESYRRTLLLDEGRSTVSYNGFEREYFVSYRYNTAVIRIVGDVEKAKLRYARENTMIVQDANEILAVGYWPTKFTVWIRHEIRDGSFYVYIYTNLYLASNNTDSNGCYRIEFLYKIPVSKVMTE